MTKMRRGTIESLLSKPSLLSDRFLDMTRLFRVGDVVESAISPGLNYGVVTEINDKTRKVSVVWNSGIPDQVDQDDIQIVPNIRPEVEARIRESVMPLKSRRAADEPEAIIPPSYISDPEMHGVVESRGGGFSIMQNLQKDLHEESLADTKTGSIDGMRARRAVYHRERGRVYQRSRTEVESESLRCPRCGAIGMEKEPFVRGVGLYRCPECGWKITTDKLV